MFVPIRHARQHVGLTSREAKQLSLSVIVPAFNEEKLITSSLGSIQAALEANRRAGLQTEIIVCDNSSTDGTRERAEQAGAKVVFEPINQISRARNTGASAASGDWLLFVDADSWPNPELLSDMLNAIDTDRYIGGGSIFKRDHAPWIGRVYTAFLGWMSRLYRVAPGSFLFCRADAFYAIKGFNTDLYAMEEIDFSKRLKKHGKIHGKRLKILHRQPLITSGRKFALYGRLQYLQILSRCLISPQRAGRDPRNLHFWYDGRR